MRDVNSFFGRLPEELTHEIANKLVESHGLFATKLKKETDRKLYPEFKQPKESIMEL